MSSSLFEYFKSNYIDLNHKVIVCKDDKEVAIASDIASFFDIKHTILPDIRAYVGDDIRSFATEFVSLNSELYEFYSSGGLLIVPLHTITLKLPKKEYLQTFEIEFASVVNLNQLKAKLYNWGYSFVDIVESYAEVSIRGDIIDIFPINSKVPYRISLFDEDVESIREFDISTQKSNKEEIESIYILPHFISVNSDEFNLINERVKEIKSDSFIEDVESLGFWVLEDFGCYLFDNYECFYAYDMGDDIDEIYSFGKVNANKKTLKNLTTIPQTSNYEEFKQLNQKDLIEFHQDKNITIIAKNEAVIKQFAIEPKKEYKIVYKDIIINLISKNELIISLNKTTSKAKKIKASLVIDELKVGDYVVHEDYGVGLFKSIEPVSVMGSTSDFIVLQYLAEDKLFVPAQNLELIDRYVASTGSVPMLDRLGKSSFSTQKAKIKQKLLEIASKIVDMAATRELIKGIKIDVESEELGIFVNEAGFEYTDDQKQAIKDIFNDLKSGMVMDRLLSGDVGFGKTEVAMNAIFAVAKSGYQSMFVAPTTLLSSQHYKTLKDRLSHFGIRVAKLDRFVSSKDKALTLKALEHGDIDVVVGTHSLFNTKFNNLGLVIVDEEHKFGVKQKENLKEIVKNVHFFSMSATPIPRTLNMALSTIKGMSQLLTPPTARLGVRTFVKEYSDALFKEIVNRELRRGGQVFYVFNSIANINQKKDEILEINPKLKIEILHSKVTASHTQKIMQDFENKKFNILLSTSIIESGIHLPNVNTIIVDGANNFGIADLHQLRGRVGRGTKEGYCYFLVEDKELLSPESTKRLLALENNSELGSGHALAYQDLEIRGGGKILGAQQSGHIKNIGYSMYLRMLEEAINLLSGTIDEDRKKDVDIKLSISAFISTELISEDRIRLELYRRLSRCQEVNDVYEIEEEMIDRFGSLDTNTKQFLSIIIAKILSAQKEIKSISSYGDNITFVYENDTKKLIKSKSKDEDDIIDTTLKYLRKKS